MPQPAHYLAPTPNTPPLQQGPDATREFASKLEDPSRWIIKQGVPVFKAHERKDPATGQMIRVDLPKLYRIAENMQKLERQGGVPIRCTLGHTEPNKSEPEQPPVGGYYRNARVQPFGPKGEPAIVVDEWLDPQYAPVRKNFPYRSAEYYDDAEQITGVALLTRDPFLDLGVVAYERGDSLVCYTAESKPDRRVNYSRTPGSRKPVLYHLVLGEVGPTQYGSWTGAASGALTGGMNGAKLGARGGPYGAVAGGVGGAALGGYAGWKTDEQRAPVNNQTPYSNWPGQSNHTRANIGHQHASAWRFQDDQQPTGYVDASSTLGGAAGGATLGMMAGGPVGAVAGGLAGGAGGALMGSRYGNQGYGRGRQGQYAEDGPGGPPPSGPSGGPSGGGDPLQQLQMLLMGAVEVLGQLTGEGGGPPQGPPPGPPQSPMGDEGAEYARYAARTQQARYAQQAPRRGPSRPAGYGRQPGRYADPIAPTPYAAEPPLQTLSGQPAGAAMALSKLNYQLQQQGQVIKMLAYERDQADTQACVAQIQNLADQGFPVSEYEVGELKAKPHDQRGAYIQHITTKYSKVGTEQMPQILGDPTPAGPDPSQGQPATKAEMEAALKIAAGSADPTAYNKALEQIRYGRQGGQPTPYGVNRIAHMPGGPEDQAPQYGDWQPQGQPGFNPANPYGDVSRNGVH